MSETWAHELNELADRRYAQAVEEIYAQIDGGAEGLEARVLHPIVKVALGYLEYDDESTPTYNPAVATEVCNRILHMLKDSAELDPQDSIAIEYDPDRLHDVVRYADSAGRPYVLDLYRETIERDDSIHCGAEDHTPATEIDSEWASAIVGDTEVHGDIGLTAQEIEAAGLGPVRNISIDAMTDISLSRVYEYHGRKAVVAYVSKHDSPGGVIARTFYLSNSQGIWRYLPSHSQREWYNKGHGEDSLAVPAVVQAELADIANAGTVQLQGSARVFFGTARSTDRRPGITYLLEVERRARYIHSADVGTGREYTYYGGMTQPEALSFDADDTDAPDYAATPLRTWRGDTAFDRRVTFELIPSKSGELQYVFAVTEDGRAWLAYAEDNSEVQSVGVRRNWVKPGNFSMPLVEYASQDGGYGVIKQWLPGNYVDMWDKYLSKAPFIQQYLASRQTH